MSTDMLLCKANTIDGEQVEGWIYPTRSRGNKEWMLRIDTGHHIEQVDIDPSTIRRVTPAVDKNGKRIFEGDKVRLNCDYPDLENEELVINWDIDSMTWCAGAYCLCSFEPDDLELIEEPKL